MGNKSQWCEERCHLTFSFTSLEASFSMCLAGPWQGIKLRIHTVLYVRMASSRCVTLIGSSAPPDRFTPVHIFPGIGIATNIHLSRKRWKEKGLLISRVVSKLWPMPLNCVYNIVNLELRRRQEWKVGKEWEYWKKKEPDSYLHIFQRPWPFK